MLSGYRPLGVNFNAILYYREAAHEYNKIHAYIYFIKMKDERVNEKLLYF